MENIKQSMEQNTNIIGPLEVIDLRIDGGAIARHDGKVVFLDDAVPGDVVMANIVQDKKKVTEAAVIEYLTLSPFRVEPWCPHFSQCGGCTWQHIDINYQRSWKKKHVEETLKRIGGMDLPVNPVLYSSKEQFFRTKVSYSFSKEQDKICIGLKQRKSSTTVPLDACLLQESLVAKAIKEFLHIINQSLISNNSDYFRFLVVHTPEFLVTDDQGTKKQLLFEVITGPQKNNEHASLEKILHDFFANSTNVTGIIHGERIAKSNVAQSENIITALGVTDLLESYGKEALSFPHSGFMQTNTGAASLLYDKVREFAYKDMTTLPDILDVYCGVGVIGLHIVEEGSNLTGIEVHPLSVVYAKRNARDFAHSKAKFFKGQVEEFLTKFNNSETKKRVEEATGVIVVDPPRSGIAKNTIEWLKNSSARKIIYVSCDVATQARDIKILCEAGWKATYSAPVDMFPHTPHIENIILLEQGR